MRPLHVCGLLLVLMGFMAVLACGESRRSPDQIEPFQKDKAKAKDKTKAKDKGKKTTDKSGKKESTDLGDINAEVTVLQVLHALDLTPAQLADLAALAPKTAQKPPPRKGILVTDRYRKALLALRSALLGGDDEKIEAATTAMDAIREKEILDFDDVEITEAARKQAPLLLRRLSARQVVQYLAGLDDFPDPVERLLEAMKESRKRPKDWSNVRDDVAYQVGWLVAGLDPTLEEKVRDRATALLNRASGLSDKDYTQQQPALRKSARDLVGKLGPTDVVRNYVERVLAETLSSHRLAAVVALLRKKK
jgi:hypothetical protein